MDKHFFRGGKGSRAFAASHFMLFWGCDCLCHYLHLELWRPFLLFFTSLSSTIPLWTPWLRTLVLLLFVTGADAFLMNIRYKRLLGGSKDEQAMSMKQKDVTMLIFSHIPGDIDMLCDTVHQMVDGEMERLR